MLMYDEVFVVLFLWRSQHEQLWKDYREYTLKDILSTTKHSFSGVLLLLLKCCEFLFGGESPTFWPCHAPSLPSPPLGQPRSQAASAFDELWSQLVTLSLQEQNWLLWDPLHHEEPITWNCIIFLGCFSTLFRILDFSAFAFSSFSF